MQYPTLLIPTASAEIKLPSGTEVQIPRATPTFERWSGEPIEDTYNNKSILNFNGEPVFAELAILRIFQNDGWDGVWVDTYRNKFRTSYWPKDSKDLPPEQAELLRHIYEKAEPNKARSDKARLTNGCWDVFCWKSGLYCFAEAKRHGHDSIRDTQRRWLEAAIQCGLPLSSFLIVEWQEK